MSAEAHRQARGRGRRGRPYTPARSARSWAAGLALLFAGTAAASGEPTVQPAWRAELPEGLGTPAGSGAVAGGRLFVPVLGVSAYDLASGALLWRSPLGRLAPRNLVAAEGRVIAAAEEVFALDAETGRELWRTPLEDHAALGEVALAGGALYVGTAAHRVHALEAASGQRLWTAELGDGWPHPAVVRGVAVGGEVVYASVEQWRDARGLTSSGGLVALDRATGRQLFAVEIGGEGERRGASAAPVVTGEAVLLTDALANAVYAFDRTTGRERWRFEGEHGVAGFAERPVVAGGMVYTASGDGMLHALDLASGRLLWRRRLPAAVRGLALCGQALLAHYNQVVWLDPADGHQLGSLMNGGKGIATSAFTVAGDRVAFAGPGGVYALHCGG